MALHLPLTTARLTLRAHQPSDTDWLQRVYSQPEVARYLLDDPWTSEDAATKVAERLPRTDLGGVSGALALVIEHEGRPVGDVALWFTDRERRIAEIGWVLDPAYAGQGFAREAVARLLQVAFETYRVHRVSAQMDARNTASARLATAVGMTHEAHLRQDWWSKGEWTDTIIYGTLASDPRSFDPRSDWP